MADLLTRFADAIDIWEKAEAHNGLILHFATQNEAIYTNFRLQRYRKALRDQLRGDPCALDMFIIQVPPRERTIIIKRRGLIAPASITTLEGEPLSVAPLGLEEC